MTFHTIRAATRDDSTQSACLLTSLGHDTPPEGIAAMWNEWTAAGNRALVAALPDGELVGVATLHQMLVLHRPKPVGRITALFVKDGSRSAGIGRTLVEAAETVLRENGCGLLEITSNFRHVDVYEFYEHLGYAKTSVRLAKDLTHSGQGQLGQTIV